jgi:precorrin-4/cobalt-precorrin-4 C11-methyltransferase
LKVYMIGAGPGDPDLLTVKAQRLIKDARICVYAGSLIAPAVLELIPASAEKHNSAQMDLEQILAVCADAEVRDIDVIRLHTGDPSIYGAINEQMDGLDRLGVDYEVVPGVSAFQAGAAALRRELTAPEATQTIVLTRVAGRTPVPEAEELDRLAGTGATLCLFLSVHKIAEIAEVLARHYGPESPAAVVYHASWPDERVFTGKVRDIAELTKAAGVTKTAMIFVGRSLARGGSKSKLYDSGFSHEFRS